MKSRDHVAKSTAMPLFGRSDEESELARFLSEAVHAKGPRLLNIVGLGGMGKTTLARVALQKWSSTESSFSHRFLSCASIPTAAQLLEELAVLFQVPNPEVESIAFVLAEQKVVLCFDNVEHLAQDFAPLLEALLQKTRSPVFLLTSRVALGSPSEQLLQLKPLSNKVLAVKTESDALSDSMQLLLHKMQMKRPGWKPQASEMKELETLCELGSGIPLALELIASNAGILSLAQIAERLENPSFDLKASGHGWEERHRSVFACVELSFRMLGEKERLIFVGLSLFPSEGFSLDLAQAAAGTPGIEDALQTLVHHSLLWTEYLSDGSIRFGMYELVRHFAHSQWAHAPSTQPQSTQPQSTQQLGTQANQRNQWFDRLTVHLGERSVGPWNLIDFTHNNQLAYQEIRRDIVLVEQLFAHYFHQRPFPFAANEQTNIDLVCALSTLILTAGSYRRCEGRYSFYTRELLKILQWSDWIPGRAVSNFTYSITTTFGPRFIDDAAWALSTSNRNHSVARRFERPDVTAMQKKFAQFWSDRPWTSSVARAVDIMRHGGSTTTSKNYVIRAAQSADQNEQWLEAAEIYQQAMMFGLVSHKKSPDEYDTLILAIERCLASAGRSNDEPLHLYALGYAHAIDANYEDATQYVRRSAEQLDAWDWTEAHSYYGIAALYSMRTSQFEESLDWSARVKRFLGQERTTFVRWGRLALAIGWVYQARWEKTDEAVQDALQNAFASKEVTGHIGMLYGFQAWVRFLRGMPYHELLQAASANVADQAEPYRLAVQIFEACISGEDPETLAKDVENLSALSDEGMHCSQMFAHWLNARAKVFISIDGSWFDANGTRKAVTGLLQRKLLQLLIHASLQENSDLRAVSSEYLISNIWPDEADPNATKMRNRLRVLIHDIRNLGIGEGITTNANGHYQIVGVEIISNELSNSSGER